MFNLTNLTEEITLLDQQLLQHFQEAFILQPDLTRSLVSFQANKERPIY
jgi:hypothetical protein